MFSEEMICSLNDLELEVYKYVVRNADKVCYMRIREFADAAHVSTSTILRFCKKAGCDGYAEFKIRLRQHLEQAKQPPVKDDVSEVIDFLKKTCSAEFEQKLDMLTRVIFQARHIFFAGSGSSGLRGIYGAGQHGRNKPFYQDYSFRKEYMSVGNLVHKHSYLDAEA